MIQPLENLRFGVLCARRHNKKWSAARPPVRASVSVYGLRFGVLYVVLCVLVVGPEACNLIRINAKPLTSATTAIWPHNLEISYPTDSKNYSDSGPREARNLVAIDVGGNVTNFSPHKTLKLIAPWLRPKLLASSSATTAISPDHLQNQYISLHPS